jgi:hypothetical protein
MKGYSGRYREKHPDYYKDKGKERYDPTENAARYQKYRTEYLRRRRAQSEEAYSRLRAILTAARDRATAKGLPFTIDMEWLLARYDEQLGCCALTGIILRFEVNESGQRFHQPYSPSLDQIIPGGGYTPDNTRLVCVVVNLALNRFGEEVLREMCEGYLAQLAIRQPAAPT